MKFNMREVMIGKDWGTMEDVKRYYCACGNFNKFKIEFCKDKITVACNYCGREYEAKEG